jgi:hypothetical protein
MAAIMTAEDVVRRTGPRIIPDPRYFSISSIVVGGRSFEERGFELDAVHVVG